MLALLRNEARQRQVPSAVLTFAPHPREYFARATHRPELAAPRIATLRDKLGELQACGIDHAVVLRFDHALANLAPEAFIDRVLCHGLGARYVLVGDDFRFGAKRAGDYAMLDTLGSARGVDVARMNSYEVHGLRVSSSAVRHALAQGDMTQAAALLGRPYRISGHVVHGRKLGRELGFPTLNVRLGHRLPACQGIFAVRVHGLTGEPLAGVANLGVRPTLEANDVNQGQVLLEVYVLDWPAHLGAQGGYGRVIAVDLLHKLHDERQYNGLPALQAGIAQDCAEARVLLGQAAAAQG
jgi:riboflavin kinase/FMN adenylyltransferase